MFETDQDDNENNNNNTLENNEDLFRNTDTLGYGERNDIYLKGV